MVILRDWSGLALGVAILLGAAADLTPAPLAVLVRAAVQQFAPQGPRRAEVAVAFGPDGRVVSSALVRSTGSHGSDAAALEGALQLAALEPRGAVAGRTLVFSAEFGAAAE